MIFRGGCLVVALLAIYPLAIGIHIGIDWLWGDAEFLRLLTQDSKRRLVEQLLSDWLSAGGYGVVAFALATLISYTVKRLAGRLQWALCVLALTVLIPWGMGLPLMVILLYGASCFMFAVWEGLVYWKKRYRKNEWGRT